MKVLCMKYFQDDRGIWHQPGTTWDCQVTPEIMASGNVKIIETASMEQPEKPAERVIHRRGRSRR